MTALDAPQAAAGSVPATYPQAIVVFGNVIGSRNGPEASSAWLRRLVADLDAEHGAGRLAPFGFTGGDELQGLLSIGADPFRSVLRAQLDADQRPMRWVIAAGPVVPGEGPATRWTGDAFLRARAGLERLEQQHDRLLVSTGDPHADGLLAALAPLLGQLLADLSKRQREIARLALVEGRRQAEIAAILEVRPATVSVIATRAKVRSIARLTGALRQLFDEGSTGARVGLGSGRSG